MTSYIVYEEKKEIVQYIFITFMKLNITILVSAVLMMMATIVGVIVLAVAAAYVFYIKP